MQPRMISTLETPFIYLVKYTCECKELINLRKFREVCSCHDFESRNRIIWMLWAAVFQSREKAFPNILQFKWDQKFQVLLAIYLKKYSICIKDTRLLISFSTFSNFSKEIFLYIFLFIFRLLKEVGKFLLIYRMQRYLYSRVISLRFPIEPVEVILFSSVSRTSFASIGNLMQQQIFKASDIKSYLWNSKTV